MESLSQKERETLKKLSDARLVANLTKAGVSSDEIEAMDRSNMLDRWARLVQTAGEKGLAVAAPATTRYDVALHRERSAFEQREREAKKASREAQMLAKRKPGKLKCWRKRKPGKRNLHSSEKN